MGIDPRRSADDSTDERREHDQHPRLDSETLKRIEYALKGTIDVDVTNLSPDDKLALLIERYNRKTKELRRLKESDSQQV